MKRLLANTVILLLALGCQACLVPFRYTTQTQTFTLQNSLGFYSEQLIAFPQEVKDPRLNFDEVRVVYTVRKSGTFAAEVTLYVSTDQVVDGEKGPNDERLLSVQMSSNDASVSGSGISKNALAALNAKHVFLVLGAENLSSSLFSSVTVDLTVEFVGTYALGI